jgi:hypothetical protein
MSLNTLPFRLTSRAPIAQLWEAATNLNTT